MIVHTHNAPAYAPRSSPRSPSITATTLYSLQYSRQLLADPDTDSESTVTPTPALEKTLSTLPTLLPPLPLGPTQHQQQRYQYNAAMGVDSDENDGSSNSQNSGNASGSASSIENNSDGEQDNGHAIATPAATPAASAATPVPITATTPTSSDLVQHCLLFPTYATRHSHSGMARKIAGVTKDEHKVLENLESRFGMFLTSNTQGAQFSIQCVGLASTTHMELAGDFGTHDHDPNVNVLLDELSTTDGAMAVAEVIQQKELFRKSLELDRVNVLNALSHEHEDEQGHHKARKRVDQPIVPLQHATIVALKSSESGNVQRAMDDERIAQKKQQGEDSLLQAQQTAAGCQDEDDEEDTKEKNDSQAGSSDTSPRNGFSQRDSVEGEHSIAGRLSKGAALIKSAMKKVKPGVMSQSNNNSSMDSLKIPPQHNTRAGSNISDISVGESAIRPGAINRAVSGDSVLTQSMTDYEDLGQGRFPTVRISSRPGGHFDGTLRMSHAEIEAHRQSNTDKGHPKFLRLHGLHQDMADTSHGIVNLIDPEGISIISDIDDTIKDTNVTAGAKIILRNTFLKEMQEVKGMASVYKDWWAQGAAIHYVSNSPWQLIPSLLEFFHTHKFPPGSAHLRMHDSMLKTYFMTPGESKRRHIREILMDFPGRKFILVGDSGEIDMEIYTEMALEFPDQILRIFIRDITTARLREMVSKMPPTRGRSFSSLLLPKVPITAAVSGLFSHRGSQSNTCHSSTLQYNASSTHLYSPVSSSNLDHEYDGQHEGNEEDNDDDGDSTEDKEDIGRPPLTSLSKGKIEEQERVTVTPTGYSQHLQSGSLEHHDGPMTPKLESNRPMNMAPLAISSAASSLSTSPNSSPQSRPIAANIRAMTHSIFGSTFKRSPSNGFNLSAGKKSSHGWNSIRRRAESMSPAASPLSETVTAADAGLNGYPFPIVGSKASSSAVSLNKEEEQRSGSIYGDMNGHKDIFEGVEHQHVVLQYQHSQHQMDPHPQQRSQQQQPPRLMQRTHTNTLSLSFSSSTSSLSNSVESALQMTPPSGPTPAPTPPMTPRLPIRGFRVEDETKVGANYSISNSNNHGQAGSPFGFSPSSPGAVPPSPDGMSLSPSTPSHSRAKNMLEVWLERVDQCRGRLPPGVLTLFESAEELEQCEIVRKMFEEHGATVNDRGHDQQAKHQQDQDSSVENEQMKKQDEKTVQVNEIKSNWCPYPSAVSLSCSSDVNGSLYSNDSLTLSISDSVSSTLINSPGVHCCLDQKAVEA
ncbi:hypothetical protein BG011_000170 [Mortierella polycephala]|uniref:Phosphatidate phosphatase APP1 catalytic domain-containing protein n=1 Tax=Mortierella polycephala TaxID=41804 RepID=A0A9P6QBH2_9FUNG|nr:hypothetical protein BG011_000170 [Mortierella polycephala]